MNKVCLWGILGALFLFIAPAESDAILYQGKTYVNTSTISMQWSAASGLVDHYNVYVAESGSIFGSQQETINNNCVVSAKDGKSYIIQVEAENASNQVGPMSDPSEKIFVFYQGTDLDVDGDGMPNDWEVSFGLNPGDPSDASQDLDGDKYTNLQEYQLNYPPDEPEMIILVSSSVDELSKIVTLHLGLLRNPNGPNNPAVTGENTAWQIKSLNEVYNDIYNVWEIKCYDRDIAFTYWWSYPNVIAPMWNCRFFEDDDGGQIVVRHKNSQIYQRGEVQFDFPPGDVGDDYIRLSLIDGMVGIHSKVIHILGELLNIYLWGSPTYWSSKMYMEFEDSSGWGTVWIPLQFFVENGMILEFTIGSEAQGSYIDIRNSIFYNSEKDIFVIDLFQELKVDRPDIVLLSSEWIPSQGQYYYLLGIPAGPSDIALAPSARSNYSNWSYQNLTTTVRHTDGRNYYPLGFYLFDSDLEINVLWDRNTGIYADMSYYRFYDPNRKICVIRAKAGRIYKTNEVEFDPLPIGMIDNVFGIVQTSSTTLDLLVNCTKINGMVLNPNAQGNPNGWSAKYYLTFSNSTGIGRVSGLDVSKLSFLEFIFGSEASGAWTDYSQSSYRTSRNTIYVEFREFVSIRDKSRYKLNR